jgi:hypothetical protein
VEFPFEPNVFVPRADSSGFDVVPGAAGAPVYWDIVGGDPTSGRPYFHYTRGDVVQKLEAFNGGGPRSVVTDLAIEVARRRLARDRSLAPPMLPLDATVALDDEHVVKCDRLQQRFGTHSLRETVFAAIDYADFGVEVDRLSREESAARSVAEHDAARALPSSDVSDSESVDTEVR